jgi:hypothetical protein
MRKALVVGINYYEHIGNLHGCVNDANAVKQMLDRNADGSVNFAQPRLMVGTGPNNRIDRIDLKEAVRQLFVDDSDVALLYFAGHGYIEAAGGYLCASDCKTGDDGIPLAEVMTYANRSPARNRVIILDSCHGGIAGAHPAKEQLSEISEGVTVLTASTKDQYADEEHGGGVFTGLMVDALNGAAANLVGQVSPGSVYAHVDQSLGTWSQRPVFKTNIKRFVSLRQAQPPIPLAELQRIATFFPTPGHQFQLDPSYEPEHASADPARTQIFAILQKYNRVGLVVPVGAQHMYHAAIGSKSAKLTATGRHYRRLVEHGLI